MLGFDDPSELVGRWSCEFISPEDQRAHFKPARRDTPFRYELKMRRRDGDSIDVETQISIIEYEGRPASLVFIRDISERKLFEVKLESIHKHAITLNNIETVEEVARSTYKSIGETLGYDDIGFGIVESNSILFKRELGNQNDRVMSQDEPGITVRTVRTGQTQFVSDTRKDPDFFSYKDEGEPISLSEIVVPVKVDGRVFAVINIESTAVNAFDAHDVMLLETLAEHVASTLAIILQKEKLKDNLKELEHSYKELDDYTYAVSHDLKAPLRTIQAFTQFLMEDTIDILDEEKQDYLRRIEAASQRMTEFIDDLLVLSRVNRKYLEVEVIDLNALVKEIELDFEAELSVKRTEIIYSDLPKVQSHRVWIRQLFANLLSNGVKYNKSTEPKVWIEHQERGDQYLFSIKDNGIGIDEKDFEQVFKLFQRLHPQDEYSGTGAGLTICKKIVESYGGKIWVESKLGVGSTFFFTLPKEMKLTLNLEADKDDAPFLEQDAMNVREP